MATTYTLTASTKASIQTVYSRVDELATTRESLLLEQNSSYTTGDGDNEVQQHYRKEQGVTSSDWDLDLYSSLTDVFGQTIIFERIHSVLVRNRSTVEGDNINVGPLSQANGWKAPWNGDNDAANTVPPSGCLLLDAPLGNGYEITTSSQFLRIEHDAVSTTVTVQIEIIGSSGTLESSSSTASSSSSLSSSSQCTSSLSSLSSEKCSESTSSSSCTTASSISSQG